MKDKYLELPNGVYYQTEKDFIFLLSSREAKLFYDLVTSKMNKYVIYTYQTSEAEVKNIAIIFTENIIRLGDL